jgi:molybdate transport system substrate-binding protein
MRSAKIPFHAVEYMLLWTLTAGPMPALPQSAPLGETRQLTVLNVPRQRRKKWAKGEKSMRRVIWFLLGVIFAGLLAGCVAPAAPATSVETTAAKTPVAVEEAEAADAETPSGELIVFAAASLTDAFNEIAQNFATAHPGSRITYNFAGSQQLAQQLGQGAPADVFASANASQMNVAIEAGRVVSGTQHIFVHNRLVVIYPADNPGGISTLQDLANPGLKIVLAASEVPVGGYSLQYLEKASASPDFATTYSETVLANVVSYEANVRSVLAKVQLGEADAGIVYSSDITQDAAADVGKIDIPDELNVLAAYPIAPIADAPNPELAQAFIEYVSGEEGQTVLAKYGFIPTISTATDDAPDATR